MEKILSIRRNGATAQRRNGATAQRRNGATAQSRHQTGQRHATRRAGLTLSRLHPRLPISAAVFVFRRQFPSKPGMIFLNPTGTFPDLPGRFPSRWEGCRASREHSQIVRECSRTTGKAAKPSGNIPASTGNVPTPPGMLPNHPGTFPDHPGMPQLSQKLSKTTKTGVYNP
ncbi:MAG: hypothetical protein PCFJNLEI_03989 [Verrucomicrobiae bacterium]|nr:hypothetical protein [Verrucomicrobiae bacterium]